ncbi:aldehyde-activating protein [Scytonema hofmannii PCC 7110]|uniref:Aldehyde-activating protein n=1 Tax=Scytonema hofmannii PCC 7110 TaxID=128403 RepID=A0A139X4X2_9CYAN|nr:GFA family protein [Scytonema hofmannii]KYC39761.1 aldehyde-activating protein [Scytonema hofmannii PCC 7110]
MAGETEQRGSCLCGAVRIAIKTIKNSVDACHCNMCRKWGGGPLLAIECGSDVQFDGTDSISIFSSSDWAERGFCSKCGSHLFYRLKKSGQYAIPVGLLDDSEQWVFNQQIFIDEKPPFYAFVNETKNLTGTEVFAQYSELLE